MFHNTFLRKITAFTISMLIFSSILPQISSVEAVGTKCEKEPTACLMTPDSMEKYIEFQNKMIDLLRQDPFETVKGKIEAGEGGLFTHQVLQLEEMEKFKNNPALQTIQASDIAVTKTVIGGATSVLLFWASAIGKGIYGTIWFTILLHDRPIVRDRARVLDIDRELNKILYELGKKVKILDTIKDMESINKIIKEYQDNNGGIFLESGSFSSSEKYGTVITFLVEINARIKNFITLWEVEDLSDFISQGIQFNPLWIEEINKDYLCVRGTFGFRCNTSGKAFMKNMGRVFKDFKNTGKGAGQTIMKAVKDLGEALGTIGPWLASRVVKRDSDNYLSENEKELLRTVYGLDVERMTREESIAIFNFQGNLKNKRKNLKKQGKSFWQSTADISKELRNDTKKGYKLDKEVIKRTWRQTKEKYKLTKDRVKWLRTIEKKDITMLKKDFKEDFGNVSGTWAIDEFHIQMRHGLHKIISSQIKDKQIIEGGTNLEITQRFWSLIFHINTIIDTVGNKEKKLRQSLYKLCSNQCKNKGYDGCYIK